MVTPYSIIYHACIDDDFKPSFTVRPESTTIHLDLNSDITIAIEKPQAIKLRGILDEAIAAATEPENYPAVAEPLAHPVEVIENDFQS